MNGGTGNFLLEKAEALALRIVRLYQHLSENSNIQTFRTFEHFFMVKYTVSDDGKNGQI